MCWQMDRPGDHQSELIKPDSEDITLSNRYILAHDFEKIKVRLLPTNKINK